MPNLSNWSIFKDIEPKLNPSQCAALHLVPKLELKGSVAVELGPVSTVTAGEVWPIPIAVSELAYFVCIKCFATMNLFNAYWQMLSDLMASDACGVISTKEVLVLKRVLHRLKNGAVHFLARTPLCSHSINNSFKSWLANLVTCRRMVDDLLEIKEKFLSGFQASDVKGIRKKQCF